MSLHISAISVEKEIALSGSWKDRQNRPDHRTNLNRLITTEYIRQETGDEGSNERASRHRSSDSALRRRSRASAVRLIIERRSVGTLVEITFILVRSEAFRVLATFAFFLFSR